MSTVTRFERIALQMRWLFLLVLVFLALATGAAAQSQLPMRWAGDPEGGAPYVEASPTNPDKLVGFDVEIAELLARGLGRAPSINPWLAATPRSD
jgi:ABC-type amino acid transport substrate-binding protein